MKKIVSVLISFTVIVSSSAVFAFAQNGDKNISLNSYNIVYEKGGVSYHYEDENHNTVTLFDKNCSNPKSRGRNNISLPAKYDSRDYGYITPVKNQGNLGTCWAVTASCVLESNAVKRGLATLDSARFSYAHLIWTAYDDSDIEGDINNGEYIKPFGNDTPYSNGGYDIYVASSLVKGCGIIDDADFPFDYKNPVDVETFDSADYYKNNGLVIDEFCYLPYDNDAVKEWIIENGSAEVSYYSETGKYNETEEEQGTVYAYYSGKNLLSNHTVSIVGWDDSFSKNYFKSSPPEDGAWLIKGTWGENDSDNGYYWISYFEPSFEDFCGFTVKKKDYDFIYTYNAAPYNKLYFNENNPSQIKYANIYNTQYDENLSAVGFFAENSNADVNVKVYELTDNPSSPENGNLILNENTHIENRGFHSIEPTDTIRLESDKTYSVVVTVDVTDGNAFMPAESKTQYDNSQEIEERNNIEYTSSDGQSYFYAENSQWVDMNQYGGNVFVNIYTDCNHENAVIENAAASTCTVEGYTGDWHCPQCGKTENGEIIPAAHKPSKPVFENSKDSTCSAKGGCDRIVYCSVCGDEIEKKHIEFELLPHKDKNGDGVCDSCKKVFDKEANDLYTAKHLKISVPKGRTVRYNYKVSMTAYCNNLPDGYFIQWYLSGEPVGEKANNNAKYVTEQLTGNEYKYYAVIVDKNGDFVSSPANNTVTIKVDGGFFAKLISFFAVIFGLNTVNLNK